MKCTFVSNMYVKKEDMELLQGPFSFIAAGDKRPELEIHKAKNVLH